ncbi:MAG: hypothetical protein KC457_07275 [Myxococcales bacterium]|nr:hypothetical protein [Myxococcales bacterium]
MPSEFLLATGAKVIPEDRAGPRVGIGCKARVKRDSDGSFGIEIRRGDGGDPEAYTYSVKSVALGPYPANILVDLVLGAKDLPMPDFTPRSYQMRIVALGGAALSVESAFVATDPYSPAGQV